MYDNDNNHRTDTTVGDIAFWASVALILWWWPTRFLAGIFGILLGFAAISNHAASTGTSEPTLGVMPIWADICIILFSLLCCVSAIIEMKQKKIENDYARREEILRREKIDYEWSIHHPAYTSSKRREPHF